MKLLGQGEVCPGGTWRQERNDQIVIEEQIFLEGTKELNEKRK